MSPPVNHLSDAGKVDVRTRVAGNLRSPGRIPTWNSCDNGMSASLEGGRCVMSRFREVNAKRDHGAALGKLVVRSVLPIHRAAVPAYLCVVPEMHNYCA
jgi:hypothetical protein